MTLSQACSFNKLIVEAYQYKGLESEFKGGIARPVQKNNLKGLRVLIQANLADGTIVPVNSIAYIKEELLFSHPAMKNKLKCDTLSGEFIVVNLQDVEYIDPPHGESA